MTTFFREIPSNFWLLLFHTDETTTIEKLSETTRKMFPDSMPPSLCNALKNLMCSHNAKNLSREHLQNEFSCGQLEEICQTVPSNHRHTLLYLPDCAEAETFLKQTILQVLSTANNAHVKLMTVSYPENFLRAETNNKSAADSISVRGEKMKSLMNQKTTEALGCKFKSDWEYEKHNSLGASVGSKKALFLFQRLLELESSDAPFKDCILSYIDLLQKGFRQFFVTEHSRTLDIDLGVTNAQCTYFECMTQPLQIIGSTAQEGNNYPSQLFSVYDENTILDTSFP